MSAWITHRLPEFWSDPLVFSPLRFEKDRIKDQHPFAYYPFGAGPRVCVGENFAMMEMILVLATLVQRFEMVPLEGHPIEHKPLITLRPRHGIKLMMKEL